MNSLMLMLQLALAPIPAPAGNYPKVYRQFHAPPAELASALFSPAVPVGAKSDTSSRMARLLRVNEKRVGKNQVFLRLGARAPLVAGLFPEGTTVKVWVNGSEAKPEGPWAWRAESSLGLKISGTARLEKNDEGCLAELELTESSAGETVTNASLQAAGKAGLLLLARPEKGK